MGNATLGVAEHDSYVSRDAYRNSFYGVGWRSPDDPLYVGVPYVTPYPIPEGVEDLAHNPAVIRLRQKLAQARSGGLSAQLVVLGDSISEGFTVTHYRNRWIDRLRRRFQGATPGGLGFLPASSNVFSSVADADWAGGDNPWAFAGAVTGNSDYGIGFHSANIPSGGGSATISYFGDRVTAVYARTTTGPTACAVTLDGVAQAAINANGATLASQTAQYGTHGNYGFHTLVFTPNDGTLVLEGVSWFDGDAPFFYTGSVILQDGTHAGWSASNFAGVNNNWSALLAGSDVFFGGVVIALGVNDALLGRTTQQFEDDLVTIASRIDARVGVSDMSYLMVMVPGSQLPYVDAAWRAAGRIGLARAAVYDLGQLRPGRVFGPDLEDDGSHPNDAGQIWMAEAIGQVLDPTPITLSPTTPARQVFDASTPVTFRSAWVESFAAIAGTAHAYDEATGGAVRERRYRAWLDPGTYQPVLIAEHATGRGTFEVLVGRWNGNTPTLTSCGTVDTSTPAGPALTTTRLATTVQTHVAGWAPVIVRKTNTADPARFVQLVLNKVA